MILVFASNNAHKLEEVKAILSQEGIEIKSMADIGFHEEIEETGLTFHENAELKVNAICSEKGIDCFADDSGLEVEILDGQPGVFSARYSGQHGNYKANNEKILAELTNKTNRKACFKTVIALRLNGEIHFFEGRVDGVITEQSRGKEGFGYDPLFVPDGYDRTFAEMTSDEKNKISHRKRALEKLVVFLSEKRV